MGRVIAIGDVHGCFQELKDLLKHLEIQEGDELIQVGDLINRGPDSAGCIALARKFNIKCLLGNHEHRLLRYHWSKDISMLKKYDFETLGQLSLEDWKFLEAMPLFHHEPYMQTVFVHGGFYPMGDIPWYNQPAEILTEIQIIDSDGQPAKRDSADDAGSWSDLWTGPPYVIFGHTPRPRVYRRPWSLGIDTACVYGGHLTACILPGQEIVQVRARQVYATSKTLTEAVT